MGKRRLSSIELLPNEGLFAVQWAFDRIAEERMTQDVILDGMNGRLHQVGLGPISMSAFNRYVVSVRSGQRKRPTIVPAGPAEDVFAPDMRRRLCASIGDEAVRRLEAAMLALVPERRG